MVYIQTNNQDINNSSASEASNAKSTSIFTTNNPDYGKIIIVLSPVIVIVLVVLITFFLRHIFRRQPHAGHKAFLIVFGLVFVLASVIIGVYFYEVSHYQF